MKVIRGVANAVLMVTLIKPMARLTVGRWRKRVQESPAAVIGIPVQELFEAALVAELAPAVEALEPAVEVARKLRGFELGHEYDAVWAAAAVIDPDWAATLARELGAVAADNDVALLTGFPDAERAADGGVIRFNSSGLFSAERRAD